MSKLCRDSSASPLGPTAMALLGQKNLKESHPFHSCAGETSKGSTQLKQGRWYSFCCCGSGDFGCEEVWSLTDRTWQKPRAQTLLYQPNLWILVVGQGGAEIDCTGEISILAIPSASVLEWFCSAAISDRHLRDWDGFAQVVAEGSFLVHKMCYQSNVYFLS